jgi:hypothetical protein
MRTTITTTLAAVTAATSLAVASPAQAARPLTMAGTGTAEVAPTWIGVVGELSGTPVSGAYTGTVTVPDGVPPLGACRPATADLTVGDPGRSTITLHATGEVCSILTAWVVHDFRGRFEVSAASKRAWRSITGSAQVKAVNGISDVYATS